MERYLIQLTEPKNGKKHEELERILKHKCIELADITFLADVTNPIDFVTCKELTHYYLVDLKDRVKEKIIKLGLATKIDRIIEDYKPEKAAV